MGKLAVLKSVSFEGKKTFSETTDDVLIKYLEDKVEYYQFDETANLYSIIQEIFGARSNIEIANCHYDKNTLIQAFSIDDEQNKFHDNVVLVKRFVLDDDTYTFLEYDQNNPSSDRYKYDDVNLNDIVNILRNKTIINTVNVNCDGVKTNDQIICLNDTEDVGKILIKSTNKEIIYLNLSNIINKNQNITENELNVLIGRAHV